MIDAEISFPTVNVALSERDRRISPVAGFGVAAILSLGLWALLALGVSQFV